MKVAIIKLDDGREIKGIIIDYQKIILKYLVKI